ncbi:MAG: hypothetical protein Q9191_007361 [Dirinaria sp. TL-2023a]
MRTAPPHRRICHSCSSYLLSIFRHGFSTTARPPRPERSLWKCSLLASTAQKRQIKSGRLFSTQNANLRPHGRALETAADLEGMAHLARQTFGDELPANFLSPEEYKLYERLYGEPLKLARPEDLISLQTPGVQEQDSEKEEDLLLKDDVEEDFEDNLLEAENQGVESHGGEEEGEGEGIRGEDSDLMEMPEPEAEEEATDPPQIHSKVAHEFKTRMTLFKDIAAANRAHALDAETAQGNAAEDSLAEQYAMDPVAEEANEESNRAQEPQDRDLEDLDEDDDKYSRGDYTRTHPLTAAARSRTSPSTVELPKATVVEPIAALLRDAPNKHMKEVAHKTFGGAGLPNSTATPSSANRHLQQAPIALEASQTYMGAMQSNVFLAAIMPGAYVSIMNTLVEIRKRLGSKWLRDLIGKEGGPRILDAGAGGAGVQAWRELLRAEWETMFPDGVPPEKSAPVGKATVVTGSNELRHRASRLLENTTFLPRLPDPKFARDYLTLGEQNTAQPRKQYDIIIAPHTLWGLKEDYMRKAHVQNFWSLLNPNGGILVIIEKGVPRGFELVAGAREMLLKRHIASTALTKPDSVGDSELNDVPKEPGMIIAPCTNHTQCPMYITAGKSSGRKDYCHFSQRFLRPRYLQNILSERDRNHEDVRFSYIAVQRGVDQRSLHDVLQGEEAREAALAGYEDVTPTENEESPQDVAKKMFEGPLPHTLGLPRAILPPIKRRGHVVLDLCTPAGRIERWTVPKSFSRQAYRDARKSQWGDLWALGAKTAVPRNIRIGRIDKKVSRKAIDELDTSASGEDVLDHISGPRSKTKKQSKRSRVKEQRKKLTPADF